MKYFFVLLALLFGHFSFAQSVSPTKMLVVIAHPDDESVCAATMYKVAKEQQGVVDVACITNGEAGFKYSTLAESYYGLELTDPAIGRDNLPRIRKQELMNAGKVLGVRNIYFFDQQDAKYNLDEHDPLDTSWNANWVLTRLKEIIGQNKYDFVFCLLTLPSTHAGHKAATLLALKAVASFPEMERPVILGGSLSTKTNSIPLKFSQLKNYKETQTITDTALYHFDRTVPFGFNGALNYQIIVNWEIAEHKSQGTVQRAMDKRDSEDFWLFKMNNPSAQQKAAIFFQRLKKIPYPTKTY